MSKISLEPNASGAGTFSIVSPDSNTNRTLNLPDEAGKLLSTGNDDPAEIFKQSNILGTVSESGGVPTGAIIERGSNSNGEFVKFADGTLICYGVTRLEMTETFRCSGVITYPSMFSSSTGIALNVSNNDRARQTAPSFDQLRGFFEIDSTSSTQSASLGYQDSNLTFQSGDLFGVCYHAIGRWY